jgi:SAM-dependent methyltransferase
MPDAAPYSVLAEGYDAVMRHVDYPAWAEYVHEVVQELRPGTRTVTELGCGTGAFARAFVPLGDYAYRGFDGSAEMVAVARRALAGVRAEVGVADFREPVPGPPSDLVVLLYDGLNYLLDPAEVSALLRHVHDALVPGGIAVIDQSTTANSERHAADFEDRGETEAFRFVRSSRYDPETRLHATSFEIETPDGRRLTETHHQRAYGIDEVGDLIAESPLAEVVALHDFAYERATEATERVHWVLARDA